MKETEQKQEHENPYYSRIELLAAILEPVSFCAVSASELFCSFLLPGMVHFNTQLIHGSKKNCNVVLDGISDTKFAPSAVSSSPVFSYTAETVKSCMPNVSFSCFYSQTSERSGTIMMVPFPKRQPLV